MSPELALQWIYGSAFLSVAWRWTREGIFRRYPLFLAFLLVAGPACALMRPHDPGWLARWYVPITIATLALRALSAGESILRQSKYPWNWLLIFGSACIAIAWALSKWNYQGIGQLRPWIDIRNHLQIALWLAFGLSLLILWKFNPAREPFDRAHGLILFCLLSIHGIVAVQSTVRVKFGAAWDGTFAASLVAGVLCCLAWHRAISKGQRARPRDSEAPRLIR